MSLICAINKKPMWLFLASLLAGQLSTVNADEPKTSTRVQDLRYGVSLWHYFQQDYLSAATALMIAEQKGGIQGHGKHPELMLAGLKMAYGMTDSAELGFRNVLADHEAYESTVDEQATRAAWYYLAEIAYIQGDFQAAENYLAEIEHTKGRDTSALGRKTDTLHLNLALVQQQTQKAAQMMVNATLKQSALAWFNLGNAYARSGKLVSASRSFDRAINELNNQPNLTETDLALRDKIHTAGGYAQLMQGKETEAGYYFRNVQRDGLTSQLALLGYGRATSEAGHYELSMGYYQALSAAPDTISNETVEARLAVPMLFEKMNQPALALASYREAISSYESHQQALNGLISELNESSNRSIIGEGGQSHWLDASRSQVVPPHAYLTDLYAESYFQSKLTELDDLHDLAALQADLSFRLELLDDSLGLREQRRAAHGISYAKMDTAELQQRIRGNLAQRRAEFEAAQEARDYLAFEADQRLELLRRIDQSGQRVNNLGLDTEGVSKAGHILGKYRGLLLWDAAQNYAMNRYQAEKSMLEAEHQLELITIKNDQVASLFRQSPELDRYQKQVAEASIRTDKIQGALAQQIADLEAEITGSMIAELQARKGLLNQYLNEARLARLRLYETSLYAQEFAADNDVEGMP